MAVALVAACVVAEHVFRWAPFLVLVVGLLAFCHPGRWQRAFRISRPGLLIGSALCTVALLGASRMMASSGQLFASIVALALALPLVGVVIAPRDSGTSYVVFGCIASLVGAELTGALFGMTSRTVLLLPAGLLAIALARARLQTGEREVLRLDPALVVVITVLLSLGTWTVTSAIGHPAPAVPLGGDVQHERNVDSMVRTGHPAAHRAEIDEFYPNTYGYWAASAAILTGSSARQILRVLPVVTLALVLYGAWLLGGALGGPQVGLLAMIALALFSFQPRQTLFDATFIGVLGEYFLSPMALLAALRLAERPSPTRAFTTAAVLGALLQLHFLSFTRTALVLAVVLPVAVAQSGRGARTRLGGLTVAVMAGTVLAGLP
jgi:hypothetical protein